MTNYRWLAEVRMAAGDDEFSISTGVPLSRRYVLTTGHGVPKPDEGEVCAEVRFIADFRTQPQRPWRRARTVWHGGDALDAALLQIDEVPELQPVFYSNALPKATADWEGAGFPAASKITAGELDGHRDSKGLHGKYQPGGNLKSDELDLTVVSPPEIPGLWRGISGAPVFCEGKLIGIVRRCPEEFAGHSLAAVPMRRLLEDGTFRRLLGYDEREKLLVQKQTKVTELLKASKEVLDALTAQPSLKDAVKNAKAVSEALLNLDVGDFVITAYRAGDQPQMRQGKAREAMEELLGELLPWLYDPGVVESTRQNLQLGMLYSLPVATETIAEIILAGADRRPVHYRKPVPGEQHPVGAAAVEPPPECGFALADPNTPSPFDEHMFSKYAAADRDRVKDLKKLRELVNDELEYIAKQKFPYRYRHYFFCTATNDPERQTLDALRTHYPQLIFISLDGDTLRSERKLCRPLRDFFAPRTGEYDA